MTQTKWLELTFKPQPDITLYEFAVCYEHIPYSIMEEQEFAELDFAIQRHFIVKAAEYQSFENDDIKDIEQQLSKGEEQD